MAISIRAARVNAGLTQTQLGESVGKSKGTIASYENYATKVPIDVALAMAKVFGMSVDDIIWTQE